jgi:hypothetical protein
MEGLAYAVESEDMIDKVDQMLPRAIRDELRDRITEFVTLRRPGGTSNMLSHSLRCRAESMDTGQTNHLLHIFYFYIKIPRGIATSGRDLLLEALVCWVADQTEVNI